MNHILRSLWLAILLVVPSAQSWGEQPVSLTWSPENPQNGSPCLFIVQAPEATSVSGLWQNHKLSFFRGKATNSWYALGGVDIEVAPGSYPVALEINLAHGNTQKLQRTLTVGEAPYNNVSLSVPDKFVQPDAASLKIIAANKIVKDKAFARTASLPLWSGDFRPPLHTAPRTDSFGTRRIFNGSLASVHRGLDYRAKTGTPVLAINSGRIVLARPLYYEGNCVIIDHGLGLMTLYMHLSKFKVKEGTLIKRGQVIALSGGTGRATGPHLHLGVRWQGNYLDPVKLFALDLPTPLRP